MAEQSEGIAEIIARERTRLYGFIRRRVPNTGDAEDILQDVFCEFARACSLPEPIEQVGAWLVRVARNRIIDRARKKREEPLPGGSAVWEDAQDGYYLDQALPSIDSGPEAAYTRAMLLEAISTALDELAANERDVFIAHELEGQSFKELSARSGINVNTLLGWKRRAILHLRSRLQPLYDELI
ncbi:MULTISPECIES: RNA polymerase sigma factor [unclassified Pseudomonas]|uniref:RNA polymerase sigma factor n=1 Tax=unclassified Pseudomonas TaxID=196821 RepID=UPI001A91CB0B|nr:MULTISPECIES: sigma-70 family RNA polymerase sigma factor [unclassified Pseudomonas]